MKNEKIYCCTRPRLASLLISKGHPFTLLPNAYRPELFTWHFPIDEDLCKEVAFFYESIGKPVPGIIKAELEESEKRKV